ncbi:MAG: phosphate-starvation-inducible PsiE family protein [Gammaproteobacteria bacterium]|nr:phosphate-starvation-inducible PsiE family protein [Gammaproteobacteria bacterium]
MMTRPGEQTVPVEKLQKIFSYTVDVVFAIILLFLVLGIGIGALKLFVNLVHLFQASGITGHYQTIITDVLTLFILVELSRSLVEYFSCHRLRMTFIADAAIVFIIREIMIGLFKHNIDNMLILSLTALLLVLGMLRIASIVVHQKELKLYDTKG